MAHTVDWLTKMGCRWVGCPCGGAGVRKLPIQEPAVGGGVPSHGGVLHLVHHSAVGDSRPPVGLVGRHLREPERCPADIAGEHPVPGDDGGHSSRRILRNVPVPNM